MTNDIDNKSITNSDEDRSDKQSVAARLVEDTDDAPIINSDEDRLGRAILAERLAKKIKDYFDIVEPKPLKQKNGLVLAILGKWGEGKTSFINLVLESINTDKKSADNINILHWDPWYFPTKTDLSQQLYKLIQSNYPFKWSVDIFRYLFLWIMVTVIFCLFPGCDYIISFLTTASIALVVTHILFNKEIDVPNIILENIVENIACIFSNNPINSLIEKNRFDYNKIKKSLEKMAKDKKLLIVIDDIDRMSDAQIKQIMDLINGIGQSPRIVYLLAFDKSIISKAINRDQPIDGERYLDKIITHPLPLYYNYRSLAKEEIKKNLIDSSMLLFVRNYWN